MTCPHIELLWFCLGGGILAALIYVLAAYLRGTGPNTLQVFAAMILGIGFFGTLHLMYGAVCPDQLVEVEVLPKQEGGHVGEYSTKIKIETLHALDILVGGLFLLYLAFRGLVTLCQHPDHL